MCLYYIKKYSKILTLFVIFLALYYYPRNIYEGYDTCNQMTNCSQCVQTKTSNDGICYWCDGSCRASDDWQEGCNSSPMHCPQQTAKK